VIGIGLAASLGMKLYFCPNSQVASPYLEMDHAIFRGRSNCGVVLEHG
jgi:hypothetical protein